MELSIFIDMGISLLLMVGGLILVFLEILFASGGLLGILAIVALGYSIYIAYLISLPFGIAVSVLIPILLLRTIQRGLSYFSKSKLVTQDVIREDAGYHHVIDAANIIVGDQGTLITDAYPSGKALFKKQGKEFLLDVVLQSGSSESGAPVKISSINGPTLSVQLCEDSQKKA